MGFSKSQEEVRVVRRGQAVPEEVRRWSGCNQEGQRRSGEVRFGQVGFRSGQVASEEVTEGSEKATRGSTRP